MCEHCEAAKLPHQGRHIHKRTCPARVPPLTWKKGKQEPNPCNCGADKSKKDESKSEDAEPEHLAGSPWAYNISGLSGLPAQGGLVIPAYLTNGINVWAAANQAHIDRYDSLRKRLAEREKARNARLTLLDRIVLAGWVFAAVTIFSGIAIGMARLAAALF